MKVEIFEGRRAGDYDKNMPVLFPGYLSVQERACDILIYHLSALSHPQVLMAGCGTGTEMLHMLDKNKSWHLTGVDPSPQMIEKAQLKLNNYPASSFQLVKGLVSDLPTAEKYDAATLLLVMHFLPDDGSKLDLLKQIAGRLKSDAPFLLVDVFGTGAALDSGMTQLENTILQKKIRPEVVEKMMVHIKNDLHICREERQLELLYEAGFTRVYRFFQDFIYGGWVATKK